MKSKATGSSPSDSLEVPPAPRPLALLPRPAPLRPAAGGVCGRDLPRAAAKPATCTPMLSSSSTTNPGGSQELLLFFRKQLSTSSEESRGPSLAGGAKAAAGSRKRHFPNSSEQSSRLSAEF